MEATKEDINETTSTNSEEIKEETKESFDEKKDLTKIETVNKEENVKTSEIIEVTNNTEEEIEVIKKDGEITEVTTSNEYILSLKEKSMRDSKELDLTNLEIVEFPEEILEWDYLKRILLGKNSISELPSNIDIFGKNLKTLDLSQNCLTKLPETFSFLIHLQHLNLGFNQFKEFPKEVLDLTLKSLDLSFNLLSKIDFELTKMETLEELDLSSNQITDLPMELTQMKKLRKIQIRGNTPQCEELKFLEIEFKVNGFRDSQVSTPVGSPDRKKIEGQVVFQSIKNVITMDNLNIIKKDLKDLNLINSSKSLIQIENGQEIINIQNGEIERGKVILDLLESEAKYMALLNSLVGNYVLPLRKDAAPILKKLKITSKQSQALFPPELTSMIPFNKGMFKKLHKEAKNGIKPICDIFNSHEGLFQMYVNYTKAYQISLIQLRKLTEQNEKFKQWCLQKAQITEEDLSTFLILPIQRIPNYVFFFETLVQLTESTNEHFDYLNKTLEMISKYSMMLNKISEEKIENIDELTNDDPDSIYQGKKLRRRNSLHKKNLNGFSDYLNLEENLKIKELIKNQKLLFSSEIEEFNEKLKSISKNLILTENNIYFFDSKLKLSLDLNLNNLEEIQVSKLIDGFLIFKIDNQKSILIQSEKKTEILTILIKLYRKLLKKELKIEVSNQLKFNNLNLKFKSEDEKKEKEEFIFKNDSNVDILIPIIFDEPKLSHVSSFVHVKGKSQPIELDPKKTKIISLPRKGSAYNVEVQIIVNDYLEDCQIVEIIETLATKQTFISKISPMGRRDEPFVFQLAGKQPNFAIFGKTRVRVILADSAKNILLELKFEYFPI
eukprot:gene4266-7602_t